MGKSNIYESINEESKRALVIDFYAYKGGIGKTTALIKTAISLAAKGKKTAVIDMDFEEPGFYDVFSSDLKLEGGVVKFLFNKYFGGTKDKRFETASLAKKLYLKKNGGAVYVIGAGRVDADYVRMIQGLKDKRIQGNRDIEELIKDLTKTYDLDYILIDSRNGINNWAGLSLFSIADEVLMFAYPDMENVKALNVVLDTVDDRDKCTVIFSKVENSEMGLKSVAELLKKVNVQQVLRKIYYDSSIAAGSRKTLESNLDKYSFISDIVLDGEVKRNNKKYISEHMEEINNVLSNFSERKEFDKVLTDEELKIFKRELYAVIIDDKIDLKNMIESYDEKKEVINLKFYNIQVKRAIEKYCKADEFLDICCLSILSLALLNIEDVEVKDIEGTLKKYFLDLYYKSNSKKGRIMNASVHFSEILKGKKDEQEKVVCIKIDELIEYISMIEGLSGLSRTKNSVLFRMINLIFNILNRNENYQFKFTLSDKKYKNDEEFLKEFKQNILDLSWRDLHGRQMIQDKVKGVFDKLLAQEIYAGLKKDMLFPLYVEENGLKQKFDEWFADEIKRRKLLSKTDIFKILQESASIENKENNKRESIITIVKLKTAIGKISFR